MYGKRKRNKKASLENEPGGIPVMQHIIDYASVAAVIRFERISGRDLEDEYNNLQTEMN